MAEKKVLVVDYDAQSLEKLAELLRGQKVQVLKASDGQAAYDIFQAEKPDLVVLEAFLSKIHGFDLTKKIVHDSGGRVPVVIITGLYRGPHYRHEALASFGAAEYFEKPLNDEKFLGTVAHLLHGEDEIEDDLPDSAVVIASLSQRVKEQGSRRRT